MAGRMMRLVTVGLAGVLCAGGFTAAHAEDTSRQDKKFVMDSGEGSLGEIEMGKLALKNSSNKEVRAFAQKMIHDHTMLIDSMKPFADRMGVPPPTMDNWDRAMKDEYKRLAGKKGDSFDKDYVETMVDDHHKDFADFMKEHDTTSNPALKEAVAKGAEVVRGHRDMIDGIAHQEGLPVPNTP